MSAIVSPLVHARGTSTSPVQLESKDVLVDALPPLANEELVDRTGFGGKGKACGEGGRRTIIKGTKRSARKKEKVKQNGT